MADAAHSLLAKRRLAIALAGAAVLAPHGLFAAEPRKLSDADLVAYEASPYDHAAMMGRKVVVGLYQGAPVVAEFPCSDICPQYTTRIVHLDIPPGPACAAAGGVTQSRRVPFSIAVIDKDFCIPRPLVRVTTNGR